MAEQLQPPAVRELDRELKGVNSYEPELVAKDGLERLQLLSTVLPHKKNLKSLKTNNLTSQCPSPSESSNTSIESIPSVS
jgi:hypothetical protein